MSTPMFLLLCAVIYDANGHYASSIIMFCTSLTVFIYREVTS